MGKLEEPSNRDCSKDMGPMSKTLAEGLYPTKTNSNTDHRPQHCAALHCTTLHTYIVLMVTQRKLAGIRLDD